jgi:hypothetical protein
VQQNTLKPSDGVDIETFALIVGTNDRSRGDYLNSPAPRLVHVVDLDGTLVRSDPLSVSFWLAPGQGWHNALRSAKALLDGRAAFKAHRAATAAIGMSKLPYDAGVIDHIRKWRANGPRNCVRPMLGLPSD